GTRGLLLILAFLVTVGATVSDLNKAGKAAYARGDFAAAERLFSQAITRAPDEPLLHYHRAVALSRLRRWRDASEAYQAVLRLDPPPALAAAAREGLRTLEPATHPPAPRVPDRGAVAIPLRRAGGGWFAEVVLNTTKKATFLVDTGASYCVISPKLAGALGLKPGRRAVTLQAVGSRTTGRLVTIRSVQVGEARAKEVHAVVHEIGPGVEGLLGNSFLSRYTVTLDPERGVLRLRPRRTRRGK
ncbi:MAG: retroviral-like aspartic protease family protein, partial [Candidatus Methylomirabilales bacterium]